ncbi:hypothetical protein BJ878DRAFT_430339 [Calycina marina]|uniref:Uncharacterized protein n=1 Tax=Calycina marina TaxID=1763456 RepID=A0A9P7YVA6_9HELO|nr:hypothetical protein BJ878DRAFT_430339 [Calycina marina]
MNHKRLSCNCGESVAEAKTMGCKYDSIMAAWLPPYCRDDDLTAEFEHAGFGLNGEWDYFSDIDKTRKMTLEEVSMLADTGGVFFVTTPVRRLEPTRLARMATNDCISHLRAGFSFYGNKRLLSITWLESRPL